MTITHEQIVALADLGQISQATEARALAGDAAALAQASSRLMDAGVEPDALARGVERLDAVQLADGRYAHCDEGSWYLVSGEEVADLGARLLADGDTEPSSGADTYSLWCADTAAREVEAATAEELEALRTEAGAAGDAAQVQLCTQALAGDDRARLECALALAQE